MKFFVDFEATQFTQEIISIGCVSETGEEFYTLINTHHEIGGFVSKLTGLKRQDLRTAPDPDSAFTDFFSWLEEQMQGQEEKLTFICYGNVDTTFALNSLKNIKYSIYAQAVLSMIISSTIDYAEYVKAYFGLSKHIALLKVAQYYSDKPIRQTHNALDDAKMLKFVYENVQKGEALVDNPFPEYMQRIERYDTNHNLLETYYGFAQAVDWIIEKQNIGDNASRKRITNKILNAAEQKKTYCGYYWVIAN